MKAERESVEIEVVAEYLNIKIFYVLIYLQPRKTIFKMLREFIYKYYFTVIILYVFFCVHKYHKKEKQNFQQLSTNNFFQNFQNLIFYEGTLC